MPPTARFDLSGVLSPRKLSQKPSRNGTVRFRRASAKLLQNSETMYMACLTLRPIASIGWLPSIMSYDDNSGREIKAGDYWRKELRQCSSKEMLPCGW